MSSSHWFVFRRFSLILFFIAFSISGIHAQVKPKSREKQKKELKEKKEVQIKKQRNAEKRLRKRHTDIQDKATKRRMKKTKRKSDRLNRHKRRF